MTADRRQDDAGGDVTTGLLHREVPHDEEDLLPSLRQQSSDPPLEAWGVGGEVVREEDEGQGAERGRHDRGDEAEDATGEVLRERRQRRGADPEPVEHLLVVQLDAETFGRPFRQVLEELGHRLREGADLVGQQPAEEEEKGTEQDKAAEHDDRRREPALHRCAEPGDRGLHGDRREERQDEREDHAAGVREDEPGEGDEGDHGHDDPRRPPDAVAVEVDLDVGRVIRSAGPTVVRLLRTAVVHRLRTAVVHRLRTAVVHRLRTAVICRLRTDLGLRFVTHGRILAAAGRARTGGTPQPIRISCQPGQPCSLTVAQQVSPPPRARAGRAPIAQSAERFHGKEKVSGFDSLLGLWSVGMALAGSPAAHGGVAQLVRAHDS